MKVSHMITGRSFTLVMIQGTSWMGFWLKDEIPVGIAAYEISMEILRGLDMVEMITQEAGRKDMVGVNHKNRWIVEKGLIMWKSLKNVIPQEHTKVEQHMNETVIKKREVRVTKAVAKERDLKKIGSIGIEGKANRAEIVEIEKKTEMSIGTEGGAKETKIVEIERKTTAGTGTEAEAK